MEQQQQQHPTDETPREVFALGHLQSGKTKVTMRLLEGMYANPSPVIPFVFTDNYTGKDLCAQLKQSLADPRFYIYMLSGNTSSLDTLLFAVRQHIKGWHDAQHMPVANRQTVMPVMLALKNDVQARRVLSLMKYISTELDGHYAVIWDEADQTYKQRKIDQVYDIDGTRLSFRMFFEKDAKHLHQLVFVTATDGELLDEVEECRTATLCQLMQMEQSYRGLSHPSTRYMIEPNIESSGSYAEKVLTKYEKYFMTPYQTRAGTMKFRKVIVHVEAYRSKHTEFAERWADKGYHCLVFNGTGLSLHRAGQGVKRFSLHNTELRSLGILCLYILHLFQLIDKPIIIIGNRKISRGIGFSHTPWVDNTTEVLRPKGLPAVTVTRTASFIWTDMIVTEQEDANQTVQKAGRLTGNHGDSEDFPVDGLCFYTTQATADLLKSASRKIDYLNGDFRHLPAGEANQRAKKRVADDMSREETAVSTAVVPVQRNDIIVDALPDYTSAVKRTRVLNTEFGHIVKIGILRNAKHGNLPKPNKKVLQHYRLTEGQLPTLDMVQANPFTGAQVYHKKKDGEQVSQLVPRAIALSDPVGGYALCYRNPNNYKK